MMSKVAKYAELLIKIGINIRENQTLIINSPIECADFARTVAEEAYKAGAREVVMRWLDEKSTKMRYMMANDEIFDDFADWQVEFSNHYADKDAAFLSIAASDPEIMKDVDPKKMSREKD